MQEVTKYRVEYDGTIHDSDTQAIRHLESLYANALTSLSHKCVAKYNEMTRILDENTLLMEKIVVIKRELDAAKKL